MMIKPVFVLVSASLLLLSCRRRDWNCTCTVNGTEISKTIPNTTKTKANSDCTDYGKSIGQNYSTGVNTYKCAIK